MRIPTRGAGAREVHRHRIGAKKPELSKRGIFIRVRDESGAKIFEAPIHFEPYHRPRYAA
jgi:hypothetical protein